MASASVAGPEAYGEILTDYLRSHSEDALYRVSLLSQGLIEGGLGPEDIIAMHFETLEVILDGYSPSDRVRASGDAQQFLLEVMIAYGVRFKEYLEIRLREGLRDAESRAAQERERALDAERVGRQKDEILTVIAHELRTPLAAVRGNLDFAQKLLTRGDVDRLPRLFENAREALDRLSRLSGDLVEASRDEMPSLRFATRELDQLVALACAWALPTAEASGVGLVWSDAGTGIRVRADEDGLLSVLGNLLSNAIRYTPSGGRVTVHHEADEDWGCIEIRDTGIGMSPEVQARIFDKFYRSPQARSFETKGLGLGLSLVHQVVEAHGGRVEVQSVEGQGSTFRVLLPLTVGDPRGEADV